MNEVFSEYIGKFVCVFFDNILIYSQTKEKHLQHIRLVFEKLQTDTLCIKLSKCAFFPAIC